MFDMIVISFASVTPMRGFALPLGKRVTSSPVRAREVEAGLRSNLKLWRNSNARAIFLRTVTKTKACQV